MFRRFILREQENEQGAAGAGDGGGTPKSEENPAPPPQDGEKSINSQAKELQWVKDLQASDAELKKLKAKQAEAEQTAEQERLAADGKFDEALGLKNKEIEKLKADGKRKDLKAEFAFLGMTDMRAVKLFIDDYDPETENADDFAARVKADEKNALYFSDPKQPRTPQDPPPAAGIGGGEKYDPSWIKSKDPKKREVARNRNKSDFWKNHHAKYG